MTTMDQQSATAPERPAEGPQQVDAAATPEAPKQTRSRSAKRPKLPLGPIVLAVTLALVAAALILVDQLGLLWGLVWFFGPLLLAALVALVVWAWIKGRLRLGRRSSRTSATRTGGRGGGRWPGLGSRKAGGARSGGAAGKSGGLRSKLPKFLGGTKNRRGTGGSGGTSSARKRGFLGLGRGRASGGTTGSGSGGWKGILRGRGRNRSRKPATSGGGGSGSGGAGSGSGKRWRPWGGGRPNRKRTSSGGGPSPRGGRKWPWPRRRPGGTSGTKPGPGPSAGPTGGTPGGPERKPSPGPAPGDKPKAPTGSDNTDQRPTARKPPAEPKHKAPEERAPAGGGKRMGAHSPTGFEDKSQYKFGEDLKREPETLEDMAQRYEAMAKAAEEDQPIDNAVAEGLREIARMLRAATGIATDLHPTWRRQHEADIHRVENPRKGSARVESKADVQSAQRDA